VVNPLLYKSSPTKTYRAVFFARALSYTTCPCAKVFKALIIGVHQSSTVSIFKQSSSETAGPLRATWIIVSNLPLPLARASFDNTSALVFRHLGICSTFVDSKFERRVVILW